MITVSETYLVTGVSGNVGSAVAAALIDSGQSVRGVLTDPAAAAGLPAGVEPVVGDLNSAATLTGSLSGVQGMFLLPGYDGVGELLAAAKRAGVRRLVQLSGSSADSRDMTNAVTAYMARAEDLACASGLAWTILRPNAFMSNAFRWLPQLRVGDELRLPFGHVPAAVIDPADIGAVAAAALTSDQHAERIYRLTGPEPLTPVEQATILAGALDRRLRIVAQPNDEARAEMLTQMPAAYVDAFFDFYVAGRLDESTVLPTVEQVLGRAPGDFTSWAHRHRAAFDAPAA